MVVPRQILKKLLVKLIDAIVKLWVVLKSFSADFVVKCAAEQRKMYTQTNAINLPQPADQT